MRSIDGSIQCLILTSFSDDEALFDSIMAGAAGYLLKQIKGTDLVDAVRRVAAGQSLLDPGVTARVLERLRTGPEEDPRLARLTDQERKILDLIAEGLTNRQIGERLFLAEKTVKNYVSNLLAKLGMERRTEAAVFATKLSAKRNGPTRDHRAELGDHRPWSGGRAARRRCGHETRIDRRTGLEELDRDECLRLLDASSLRPPRASSSAAARSCSR